MKSGGVLLLAAAVIAIALMAGARRSIPPMGGGLDAPPTPTLALATSLGDSGLAYRMAALRLQIGGEWGGRVTPMTDYDYNRVAAWLTLLDRLDSASGYAPALATYLYGQTRRPDQLAVILTYLKQRAESAPARDWPWLVQAVYLARSRLTDRTVGQTLALDLAKLPGAPEWTCSLALAIASRDGDRNAARAALAAIQARGPLSKREAAFVESILSDAK